MSNVNYNSSFCKSILKFIVITFILSNNVIRSQNLVRNGSFEFYVDSLLNYSKDNMDGFDGFVKYENTPSNQFIGSIIPPWLSYNTADYFNENSQWTFSGYINGNYSTYTTLSIPRNSFGSSFAKDSNYYAGFIGYAGNMSPVYLDYKEYIYQQLDFPLINNETYCLSFWVKLSPGSNRAIKEVGAFLTNTLPSMSSTYYISAQPQVLNNTFIADTSNWTLVQGCFTADGGEQYIMIGNFNSNINTSSQNIGNNLSYLICCDPKAYYYIDDISLVKYDITTDINKIDLNSNNIMIYPNPTKDILHLKTIIDKNLVVSIKDIVGKEVVKIKDQKEINVSTLEKGIYFVDVYQGTQKIITKKIIKD